MNQRFEPGNCQSGSVLITLLQTFTRIKMAAVCSQSTVWQLHTCRPAVCEILGSTMAWRQMISLNRMGFATLPELVSGSSRFFSKSTTPYIVKVGIPEFLTGVGKGVETHIEKLENEIGDFQQLLVTRTLKLKKLGIPCKHRKLILKYTHKYRLGLWRPQAEPGKSQA